MISSLLARQSADAPKTPELRKAAAEWLLSIRFVVVRVPPAHVVVGQKASRALKRGLGNGARNHHLMLMKC